MKRAGVVVLGLMAAFSVGLLLVEQSGLFSSPLDPSPQPIVVATRDLPGPAGDRITVKSAGSGPAQLYSLLNIRAPMQYGDFRWNDDGVPAGPLWVRVGLRHQTLSVFRGGHEIGTAVILYGADNKPTPLGTFPILARLKDHRSSQYDAPMPFTLRLTGDGVAIHGSNVRWGAATHGCIGVPLEFAARLYDQVHVGDLVTITDGASPPVKA